MKINIKKSLLFTTVIICSLTLTSCGSGSSAESKESDTRTNEVKLSPIEQFRKVDSIAMENDFDEQLTTLKWSLMNTFSPMAEFYDGDTIKVTADDNFEIVTVTARASISRDDTYGWNLGLGLTVSNPSKAVCAGESQYGLTSFHDYLDYTFTGIKDHFKFLPSKGIVFKIDWVGLEYKTDKYGADTEVLTDLQDDQVGFTSVTFGKIVDVNQINPWKLSDLGEVVKHNSAWDGSLGCKYQQQLLN